MKKFNITVNGQAYEVEVEEVGGAAAAPRAAAPKAAPAPAPAPAAAPAPAPAPAPAAAPAAAAAAGETSDTIPTAMNTPSCFPLSLMKSALKTDLHIILRKNAPKLCALIWKPVRLRRF